MLNMVSVGNDTAFLNLQQEQKLTSLLDIVVVDA